MKTNMPHVITLLIVLFTMMPSPALCDVLNSDIYDMGGELIVFYSLTRNENVDLVFKDSMGNVINRYVFVGGAFGATVGVNKLVIPKERVKVGNNMMSTSGASDVNSYEISTDDGTFKGRIKKFKTGIID